MRDERLDFFKGILIWSVVLGHCINAFCPDGNTLHLLLRTFDLPMFMCISGFLLKGSLERNDWKQVLMNKLTGLVMPAVVWTLVSWLLGDRCFYYFLWAVFASTLFVCLCERFFSNRRFALGVLVLLAATFHLFPFKIANLSFLFPFFLMGYYSQDVICVGWRRGLLSLVFYVILFVFLWQPEYTIWNSGGYVLREPAQMIPVVLIRLGIGVAGIWAVSFLLGGVHEKMHDTAVIKFFERLGQETLAIYVMQHVVVEMGLPQLVRVEDIYGVLACHPRVTGWVVAPGASLVLLVAMFRLALLLKKSASSKWVFGFRMVK